MSKLEIRLESIMELRRNGFRPPCFDLGHLPEEASVPLIPLYQPSVDLHHHPPKQIFRSRIKRVQEGR